MKRIVNLFVLIGMMSCSNEPVNADFVEIKNDIARFDIVNESNKNIKAITFEIKYIDSSKKAIKVDTLNYQMNRDKPDQAIFLKANESTFIVQEAPKTCTTADIKILVTSYIEND